MSTPIKPLQTDAERIAELEHQVARLRRINTDLTDQNDALRRRLRESQRSTVSESSYGDHISPSLYGD